MREFSFSTSDLRIETLDLLTQLTDVGGGEGWVERRQQLPRLHNLALAHVDGLDDRGVERLKHSWRFDGDNLAGGAGDHAIDARHADPQRRHQEERGERKHRGARSQRFA